MVRNTLVNMITLCKELGDNADPKSLRIAGKKIIPKGSPVLCRSSFILQEKFQHKSFDGSDVWGESE